MSALEGGYALITGASRGLGAALAQALAAEGRSLILTARTAADLETQQRKLGRPGVEVQVVAADLAHGGAQAVLDEVNAHGWAVSLLINNAGVGSLGEFTTLPVERELEQVRLNLEATVALTHALLRPMRARHNGAVINVASTAALQPVPYMATYAATKVFLLHFSLALREELRGTGIHVMALCPGPMRTSFFEATGIAAPSGLQSAESVARMALAGLRRRKAMVNCHLRGKVLNPIERLLPRTIVARMAGQVVRSWRPGR